MLVSSARAMPDLALSQLLVEPDGFSWIPLLGCTRHFPSVVAVTPCCFGLEARKQSQRTPHIAFFQRDLDKRTNFPFPFQCFERLTAHPLPITRLLAHLAQSLVSLHSR